ncbi:hypothetical protein DH2020_008726 [Rehmannia glutinosa]|uniref:Uncharacterized protein n=1 Tax=Rehmannia glutinosa TaxID=99300 RepID=A0ABR0X482_REHGL
MKNPPSTDDDGHKARTRTQTSQFTRSLCSSTSPPSGADVALKNVTKSNFEPALAELRRHVREADFVSIDLEMTGVTSAPWRESFEFDRLDIQYLKIKDSAEKFAVVQFGDGSSSEFLCQTSSLEFLAKYQFDFNACIYEGNGLSVTLPRISYLSRSQEDEALRRLDSVYKDEFSESFSNLRNGTQLVRMADILFAERMNNIVSVTEKHFKDLTYVHVTGKTSSPQPLIVYTDSTTDRDLLVREVKACQRVEAEKKIKAAIGFRHVIDLLSSERKLIVGHNCFLDDVLSSIMRKGSTSLSKAFGLLCPPIAPYGTSNGLTDKPRVKVEVEVDDQRFSNWNSGSKHEAGYDAFMTGCVFSQACLHLGIDFNSHAPLLNLLHNEKLQKYINYLYLSWVNGDLIDLRTGKSATESLVFGTSSITSIYHLDDTSAFVQFSKPELVSDFLELKDKLKRDNDPISVLHPLSKILEGGRVRAGSYEMYKEICSLSLSEMLFADQAEAVGINWEAIEVGKQEEKIFGKECDINAFSVCQDEKKDNPWNWCG